MLDLIRGCWDGDGCLSRQACIISASEVFINQLSWDFNVEIKVFINKLGDVGTYFIAILVKNIYSTIPTHKNTITFSISICFRDTSLSHPNERVAITVINIPSTINNVNTAENLTNVFLS